MPRDTSVDVVDRPVLEELERLGEPHTVERLRRDLQRWKVKFSLNADLYRFRSVGTDIDTPDEYWLVVDAVESVGADSIRRARVPT